MIYAKLAFPVFIVDNITTAKEFYTSHFGFNAVFENEWYIHLVSESGIQIGFMLPNQPTQPDEFHAVYRGEGMIFSLEVDDADAAYTYAKERSLQITLELRSEDWGQRHFCVKDPNGIYLDIVQSTQPSEEYEEHFKNG